MYNLPGHSIYKHKKGQDCVLLRKIYETADNLNLKFTHALESELRWHFRDDHVVDEIRRVFLRFPTNTEES